MATNILRQYLASTTPNPNRNALAEGIQSGAALRRMRLEDEQNALARMVGGSLAANDLAGASGTAFRGGDLRTGLALRGEMASREQAAEQARQQFGESFATFAGGILQLPEPQQKPAYQAGIRQFEDEARRLGINFESGPMDRAALQGIAARFGKLPTATGKEGFTLGPGQTRFGPGGQKIASVPKAPDEADFGQENKVLTAYEGNKGTNAFRAVGDNVLRVNAAFQMAQNAAADPAGEQLKAASDLSMIFSFMKILDPTSVVREGEQATARNAAGVPDRIKNIYNRIITGESLTPEQRQAFHSAAMRLYQEQKGVYRSSVLKPFQERATRTKLDPSVITDLSAAYDERLGLAVPAGTGGDTPDNDPLGIR